ncbi:MAG: glycosyl transferase, partial [Nonlabens sp.]
NSRKELFDLIQNMSDEEYDIRMNKCIGVYNQISELSPNQKNELRLKSLNKIIDKISEIL